MDIVMIFALNLLLFAIGVTFVVWGSNGVVFGADLINKITKIPMFFIGMFMVSIATTSPEFTVSLFSVLEGNYGLAIGNFIGSNILNIALILGIGAAIGGGIGSDKYIVWKQIPIVLVATIIMGILSFDGNLSRLDGLILLGFFAIYLLYLYLSARQGTIKAKNSKQEHQEAVEEQDEPLFMVIFWNVLFGVIDFFRFWGKNSSERKELKPILKLIIFMIVGFTILILGSRIMVTSAVKMATILNMSETFIGLTIVALGTSMPELAVSLMAIIKKKKDLAIGNIVGANTMNILWGFGFNATFIATLPFDKDNNIDVYAAFVAALLLWLFMFIGKKYRIDRWQGIVFIAVYIGFVAIKYLMLSGQ
jgi:cation:H+ antiporter